LSLLDARVLCCIGRCLCLMRPHDGAQPQDHVLLLPKAAGIVLRSCVERLHAQLEGAAALAIPQAGPPASQAVGRSVKVAHGVAGR
jgi:hypothetical protein